MAEEGAAFGIVAVTCIVAFDINGGSSTAAVVVVSAFFRFAVDLNLFASAASIRHLIGEAPGSFFTEASAGSVRGTVGSVSKNLNFTLGAKLVLVVHACSGRTF